MLFRRQSLHLEVCGFVQRYDKQMVFGAVRNKVEPPPQICSV